MTQTKHSGSSAVDLTHGSPVRLILLFALPLMAGQLLQQVYSISDTMIAGRVLGNEALAAIGATASLYNLVLNFVIGLSNGCGIVLGRLFGARDAGRMRKAAAIMLYVDILTGLLLTILTVVFSDPLLQFLNTPEQIYEDTSAYMLVLFGGILVSVCYNMQAGFMRSLGNSRIPLYFLMLACGINILLDLLFMAVFHMGVRGAALATLAAQAISAVCSFLYILRHFREYLPRPRDFRPDFHLLKEMTVTGMSMALMSSVVNIGSVMMTSAVNSLGEAVIAADATARKIFSVIAAPMVNVGVAGSAFASQNFGAGKYARIRLGTRAAVLIATGWSLIACLLIFTCGGWFIQMIIGTGSEEIVSLCVLNTRVGALMYIPLSFLLCIRQIMQALGMHVVPVVSSFIELAMKLLCVWFIIPPYGYQGAVWGEPSTWVACGLFMGILYLIRRRSVYPDLREKTAR